MPFPMKIQPIDSTKIEGSSFRTDPVKPVVKSRFKRLFLRNSSSEKTGPVEVPPSNKDGNGEFEPSSVCLAKMVQNFIEENNEKQKCGRNRCNCFNGNNCSDSSDDELDLIDGFSDSILSSSGDAVDILKSLVSCANVTERNLLADASKIAESNKVSKPKGDFKKIVNDGLLGLGYESSICKSRWEKSPSFPAGEYEYIDVMIEGERLIIDIDFRSEFEIARSTGSYKAILQSLPLIYVGKSDRLQQIVSIVSEAAKQSLKKKGMHFPPWRKAEYMRAKWLSPYTRASSSITTTVTTTIISSTPPPTPTSIKPIETKKSGSISTTSFSGEFELIFGENSSSASPPSVIGSDSGNSVSAIGEDKIRIVVSPWQPPAIKPKSAEKGSKIVTGLASILKEKP